MKNENYEYECVLNTITLFGIGFVKSLYVEVVLCVLMHFEK